MGIKINTGFDLGAELPLDSRMRKATIAERDALVTGGLAYEGLEVYCLDTKLKYRYNGTDWLTVYDGANVEDIIDDADSSANTTYSSDKIDTDFQKAEDNTLTTTKKTIAGAINELDTEIGVQANEEKSVVATGMYKYIDDKVKEVVDNASDGTITEDIHVYGIPDGFGYKNGDVIPKTTTTFTAALKKLLQVVIPPEYKAPTLTVTTNKTILESGVENTVVITPKFTQNNAGAVTSFKIFRNETEINTGTEVKAYTDTFTSTDTPIVYKCMVDYGDGAILKDNTGKDNETGRILSGTKMANAKVDLVSPYYIGVATTNTLDEAKIKALTKKVEVKGAKTIDFTTSQSYMVFAYPKSYGSIKSIIDKNGFEVISSFTSSIVSINSIEYYVYVSNKCSGSYSMKFNF